MKLKKNRFKQFGEISWMVFAMSIVTIGVLAENSYKKLRKNKI